MESKQSSTGSPLSGSPVEQVKGSCLCWPSVWDTPCNGCGKPISTKTCRSVPFRQAGYWRFLYLACPHCLDLFEEIPTGSRPSCTRYRWLEGVKAEVRSDFGLKMPLDYLRRLGAVSEDVL